MQSTDSTSDYCFDVNALSPADFNVNAWVEAVSSSIPLEVIQRDLSKYYESIKTQLIDSVNHDYATFVELSSKLKQIKQGLDSLEVPLKYAKIQSDEVSQNLLTVQTTFSSLIQKHKQLQQQKRVLELFTNIEQLLSKCEELLNTNPMTMDVLQRLSRLIYQLTVFISQAKINQSLGPITSRFELCKQSLLNHLDGLLLSYVDKLTQIDLTFSPNRRDLQLLFRCYVASVNRKHVENIIREQVVIPICTKLITQESLDENVRHSYNGLSKILDNLYNYSSNQFKAFNDVANQIADPIDPQKKAFDFYNNSLWRGITEYFTQNFNELFSPPVMSQFHNIYSLFVNFYDKLSALNPNHSINNNNNNTVSPWTSKFMKKFNFTIYSTVILQDYKTKFISKCNEEKVNISSNNKLKYNLEVSNLLYEILYEIFSDKVFILPVVDEFVLFTFQLIRQYSLWTNHIINDENTSNDILTSLLLDCDTLYSTLSVDISTLLSQYIDSSLIEDITESLNECLSSILLSRNELYNRIANYIIEKCLVNLDGVLSIPPSYRMTNKPAPSTASPYVNTICKPIDTFLLSYSVKLSSEMKNILFTKIITEIKDAYIVKSKDVLETIKKTEEVLNKRNKKSQKPNTPGSISDGTKMKTQLYYDLMTFSNIVNKYNIQVVKQDEEYQKLIQSLLPDREI